MQSSQTSVWLLCISQFGQNILDFLGYNERSAPTGAVTFVTNVQDNASGVWSAALPNGLTRLDVTMIAEGAGGNTSEMSPRPQILLPLIRS